MTDIQKLRDFQFFSENFFKIRTKTGEVCPFIMNRAQIYLHQQLEKQLRETGKVRAVILKGRQQGISTYAQARYFHKTITHRGIKTFILTHEAEATKNLFEMTKRYYEYLPAGLCPKAAKDSTKELRFDTIDSGYSVGTAGNKGAGRSQTIQLCHCSEVGFYPHAEEHAQGLLQAIGTQNGTELILESTANGIGNYFHSVWTGAEQGTNGFIPIFIPWYWQTEYIEDVRNFKPTTEELELFSVYGSNGLTMEHIAWRRKKIYEFNNDYDVGRIRFDQEYPITSAIAFTNPIDDTFINAVHVVRARKVKLDSDSPLIIGVDPAIGDNDRCAIIRRRGRKAFNIELLKNHNTMELAGHIKLIIEKERPQKVCIDCIGIGAGVTDRLLEMGFECVEAVNVARTANVKERFANQRAEIWSEMRDWLMGELPVDLPDDDELHRDLCSLGYKHRSNGQLLIESKIDLKKRGIPSPDCFVGDTNISTPKGNKKIKDLKAGDYVDTPMGQQRIARVIESTVTKLTTVKFSNNKTLVGKPTHKIFTWSRGWITMDALTLTDRVESNIWIKKLQWKLHSLLCTRAKNIDFKQQVNTINPAIKRTRKDFYTGKYGSTITDALRKINTYTIKMVTGKIKQLQTCNQSTDQNTNDNTCLKGLKIQNIKRNVSHSWKKHVLKRQNGISQKKVRNGTKSMQKTHGLIAKKLKLFVSVVTKGLSRYLAIGKTLDFVPENANKKDVMNDKKHLKKYVFTAMKSLWPINTEMLNVVPEDVQSDIATPTKVYNLSLENENVYYANGILVANCGDALALTFTLGQHIGATSYHAQRAPDGYNSMFT